MGLAPLPNARDVPVDDTGGRVPLKVRLCLGVTGHRDDNPLFAARRGRIRTTLERILELIDAELASEARAPAIALAPTRMHSLLADGADQMAAEAALLRGWELVAPLPFGLPLNIAIGARPADAAEAEALLKNCPSEQISVDAEVRDRAERIRGLAERARLFELAENDDAIAQLLQAKLRDPTDRRTAQVFEAELSLRVALASRVMIEQSDFVIAIWDGTTRALVGGTGHTIQTALELGAPVIWIDVDSPEQWRILSGPEALAGLDAASGVDDTERNAALRTLVRGALHPDVPRGHEPSVDQRARSGPETLQRERWRPRSTPVWHLYRRVEALFGERQWGARFRSLRQVYETPQESASGSSGWLMAAAGALPRHDAAHVTAVESKLIGRFIWADGVSSYLSDIYRGGMTANFMLGACAIVGGLAYLPLASSDRKWLFALFELLLLAAILGFTIIGRKRRWHGRWLETRRVAEYLRHAPILQLLGVARAPGRWPVATKSPWPEWYVRHLLRDVGLPRLAVTPAYLRNAVRELLHRHVVMQRDYHVAKAQRLAAVHHNLDRFSEVVFLLAVLSVVTYLTLKGGGLLQLWPKSVAEGSSYWFTFLGAALPTVGGAVAGIRYFGDFERFAAISSVTAEKLQAIHVRATRLLAAADSELDYGRVADLAHAMDDVVVSEIESWQAVFAGKQVTVPV